MIRLFRDRYKMGQLVAVIYVLAILVSAYQLYSLPVHQLLSSQNSFWLTITYLIVACTFITGGLAIYLALTSKRELIVFREKINDETDENVDQSERQGSNISLESIRKSLTGNLNNRYSNFLQALCKQLEAGQGAFYIPEKGETNKVKFVSGYAFNVGESTSIEFEFGEGLVGQVAAEQKTIYLDDIPEGYIKIISGLGSASPRYLLIAPVKEDDMLVGVIEIASFKDISKDERSFVEEAIQLLVKK